MAIPRNMELTGLNLLLPDKPDVERDAMADAFAQRGGTVHRIDRFWDPPAFVPATVRVYGPDSFCLVLQQKLNLALCSPDDDLILRVPANFIQRQLTRCTLDEALSQTFPVFIKPVVPKQFRGAVYLAADALAEECRGLLPDVAVFRAEPVKFTAEVRCFILDQRLLDAAVYEGEANLVDAARFVADVTKAVVLPRAVVVDVGWIAGRGWAVIEFNAAWGAGLNGCDPKTVLPAIVAASSA